MEEQQKSQENRMEGGNFKYKLAYEGVDRISNRDAKTILKLTYLQLTDVFQNEENNQRLLATFLLSGILRNIESAGMRNTNNELSCEAWARQFFHLLSRRYDIAAALDQLIKIDDPNLKSYKEQIHRIFNTLNDPAFPKKLELTQSQTRAAGKYENSSTVPLIERCDSYYCSNERSPERLYYRQDSRESQTSRSRSKRAGVTKAGYRITKSDYTFFEASVENPNEKVEVLNSQFGLQENINNHDLDRVEGRFLNVLPAPVGSPSQQLNSSQMSAANLINYTNQAKNSDNATFFDRVLTEHPINLEIQIQNMCETQSSKNVSLKIELLNESYGLRIQCQSEVINMRILKQPTTKIIYEILSKVSDLKHLEIFYSKQDETTNDKTNGALLNVDLSSLETVSILFTRPDYSCRDLDTFLKEISHVKLTKFVIIGMHIEIQNKVLIEKIIDNMVSHRTLLLKNINLQSELNIKSNNTSYRQLHLHLHISHLNRLNMPNNAVIKLLKGTSFVEDFMTNIPISDVALKELKRLKVQTLDVVHIVNKSAETMTFSHLKKLGNLRKFVVRLSGWHPGNMTAPYLGLEGFKDLPNGLIDLEIYANFPIVIKEKPRCMI